MQKMGSSTKKKKIHIHPSYVFAKFSGGPNKILPYPKPRGWKSVQGFHPHHFFRWLEGWRLAGPRADRWRFHPKLDKWCLGVREWFPICKNTFLQDLCYWKINLPNEKTICWEDFFFESTCKQTARTILWSFSSNYNCIFPHFQTGILASSKIST